MIEETDNKMKSGSDSIQNEELLVEVSGLSKKFCKDLKTSLWYGVKDLVAGYSGNKNDRELRPKEFWAVKDISFTLKRGECLGLIGHNGAGKSTLLKVLNGLINPDSGKATIKGRVGALIELGAGFNPILSGRENIYNNGAVLGFSRSEIDEKLEHIIEFSELREFIDMPVQNYSSGMKVRLGFAVAAQMEPDVLIIDEVLAVGDLGFVLKCFKTIDQILPNTAIIFVSHSMPMVSRICTDIILMDKGRAQYQGKNVSQAIDLYYTRFANNQANVVFSDNTLELESAGLIQASELKGVDIVGWGEDLNIEVKFKCLVKSFPHLTLHINIMDKEQRPVALIKFSDLDFASFMQDDVVTIRLCHPKVQLSKGVYSANIAISSQEGAKYRVNSIFDFQVKHDFEVWPPFLLDSHITNLP